MKEKLIFFECLVGRILRGKIDRVGCFLFLFTKFFSSQIKEKIG